MEEHLDDQPHYPLKTQYMALLSTFVPFEKAKSHAKDRLMMILFQCQSYFQHNQVYNYSKIVLLDDRIRIQY